ncbi:helix-turn-helix domain-containing protein [Azotobacter beijerinckii]|uniref:helix-turn-helix domain-containing protein n=1 Tax=Azotobacter beijerinckii TaxID=170623 RepID=UPI000B877628|nr:helix-turn-helix transcriptional regulator [Azotobacter beijerinckii]
MKTLGARIAHYRKAAGLSQAELATACGWKSQSRIGNYEKDTREPTLADLEKIATALGMSVSQLAYGDHVKIPQPAQPAQAAEIARIAQAAPGTPASAGQSAVAEPAQRAAALAALATPRSQEALERIAKAANEGRLTEADLILLEQIASRLESSGTKHQMPALGAPRAGGDEPNGNRRLREQLRNNDPGPRQ